MSDPSRHSVTTLLDACVVLSLYATRRMPEILSAVPGPAAIVDLVAREALYVRRIVDGQPEREPVDLAPLISSAALEILTAEDEDELQTFVDRAVNLDDGEAMTAALAIHRGLILVTDDRKAERLLTGRVRLRATLDLVKSWADGKNIGDDVLHEVVTCIYERGYQPPIRHPLKRWWDRLIGGTSSALSP
jgi:predicted nucleic acid-binding protein